eukprot:6745762-Pyramimonas_sp.AAC.1
MGTLQGAPEAVQGAPGALPKVVGPLPKVLGQEARRGHGDFEGDVPSGLEMLTCLGRGVVKTSSGGIPGSGILGPTAPE